MRTLQYIVSIVISTIVMLYLLPRMVDLFYKKKFTVKNYAGQEVATGAGFVLFISCQLSVLPFAGDISILDYLIYMNVILSFVLLGIVDDFFGDKAVKGLKGHIKVLFEGNISTGIIKMALGIFTGFIVSFVYYNHPMDWFMNTLLFALFINFINLMDLRPGRAIKVFIIIALVLSISSGFKSTWIMFPAIASVLLYIKGELNEYYMLGDTGANLLGGILGLYSLKTVPVYGKYYIVAFLIFIHLTAEFYSLSKFIESNTVLRYIDRIGTIKKER